MSKTETTCQHVWKDFGDGCHEEWMCEKCMAYKLKLDLQTTTRPITFFDGFIFGVFFAGVIVPLMLSFIMLGALGGPSSFWLERTLKCLNQ